VPRVISFLVLLAIVLLVGMVFFQVMAQFIVPLFLAAVLVVVFQPLHNLIQLRLPGHPRLAALTTTVAILLVVLLPLVWLGWNAYIECYAVYDRLQAEEATTSIDSLPTQLKAQLDKQEGLKATYKRFTNKELDTQAVVQQAMSWATTLIGPAVLTGVQTMLRMLVGLVIMVAALYYYLADGPAMTSTLMRLSPLDEVYEWELLDQFSKISRSVVVATLLSAVVQGLAAGVGYWFALPSAAPIFLLTALTMVFALVPFVGSAVIWVPVCGWLFFFAPHTAADGQVEHGSWVTAVVLAAYCAVVVSSADNVIKPLVLRGQANLHPLLALLSILGGVQVLGPIGILVGPMIVSFLQALLNMLNKELASFEKKSEGGPSPLAAAAVQAADAVKAAALDESPPPTPKTSHPPAGDRKRGRRKK
jgi:predicted PurR-regulated permease PerM